MSANVRFLVAFSSMPFIVFLTIYRALLAVYISTYCIDRFNTRCIFYRIPFAFPLYLLWIECRVIERGEERRARAEIAVHLISTTTFFNIASTPLHKASVLLTVQAHKRYRLAFLEYTPKSTYTALAIPPLSINFWQLQLQRVAASISCLPQIHDPRAGTPSPNPICITTPTLATRIILITHARRAQLRASLRRLQPRLRSPRLRRLSNNRPCLLRARRSLLVCVRWTSRRARSL